jgi:hypothetical protein
MLLADHGGDEVVERVVRESNEVLNWIEEPQQDTLPMALRLGTILCSQGCPGIIQHG